MGMGPMSCDCWHVGAVARAVPYRHTARQHGAESDRADVCGEVAFADRLPQTIAEAARARVEWERAVLSRVEMVLTAVQSGIADEEVP